MAQSGPDAGLYGRICFILMKAGVTDPEINECLNWGFGPGVLFLPIYPDWMDRWMKLHPEYPVSRRDKFVEWIFVVGYLFVQWKKIKEEHLYKFRSLN